MSTIEVWVCVPVHNRVHFTLRCLESLARQDCGGFKVVVCDDGSTDGTSREIRRRFPHVHLLQGDGNLWWAGAMNRCVRYVLGESQSGMGCVVTLNDDLVLPRDYLSSLLAAARKHPQAVITSAVHDIDDPGRLVFSGDRQNWITTKTRRVQPGRDHLEHDASLARVTHAPGRGTLIPLSVFRKVGLFDEKTFPQYGADYDFTHKARRAGHDILICFHARLYSHVNETGLRKILSAGMTGSSLKAYYTDIKSPANLRARINFALRNCPLPLIPSFLVLDLLIVTGSYFKRLAFRHHG